MAHNLKLRILFAIIAIPFCLLCLWMGSPYLDILALIVLAASLYEWSTLTGQSHKELIILMALSLITVVGFYIKIPFLFLIIVSSLLFYLIQTLLFNATFESSLIKSVGFGYITTALMGLIYFAHIGKVNLIVFLLCIVWSADIGAYFSGRFFGGPKLAPTISPSKTWSGFIGGTLLSFCVAIFLAPFLKCEASFLIYVILILSSHLGDLLESALKRHYNVKDSSHLIPGHGGFLDRLDSLFLVSLVAIFLYL